MPVGNFTLPSEHLRTCTDGMLYCFFEWGNLVTTGLFVFLAFLSFVVIIFLASSRFGSRRAFGFASFVGLLGGVWLSVLQLIPWWMGSMFIISGVIGLIVLVVSEK